MSASPGHCTRPARQQMARSCSRAPGARPIVLTFAGSHLGGLDATLQTEPAAPSPIVAMQSHVRQGPSGIQLEGRATRISPSCPSSTLVLPIGVDLQNIAGTMQATWTVTASGSFPRHSLACAATVVSGTAALTLTLPKFAGVGDNLSVRFNGEVTGNAEQLFWTLSKDSRLEGELDRGLFLFPTRCNGCCLQEPTCGTGMSGAHQGATEADNHTSPVHRRRPYTGAVRRSPGSRADGSDLAPCGWAGR